MVDSVPVTVQGLGGDSLVVDMEMAAEVGVLRSHVAMEWALDPDNFRFLAGSVVLGDSIQIGSLVPDDGTTITVQLVRFDPLPKLGQFDQGSHEGIRIEGAHCKCSTLVKTSGHPDSNNVFLLHPIREPCFVEFQIVCSRDEMSLGVTYEAAQVEAISGFGNLSLSSTWIFSKKRSMPSLLFHGQRNPLGSNIPGFVQGDRVTVHTDPQERWVKFYKNRQLVASNLPDHPLPAESETPLRMYVMVDDVGDEVSVIRFGPGDPYSQA